MSPSVSPMALSPNPPKKKSRRRLISKYQGRRLSFSVSVPGRSEEFVSQVIVPFNSVERKLWMEKQKQKRLKSTPAARKEDWDRKIRILMSMRRRLRSCSLASITPARPLFFIYLKTRTKLIKLCSSPKKATPKKATTVKKSSPPPKKAASRPSSRHSKVQDSDMSPNTFTRKKKTEAVKEKSPTPKMSASKDIAGKKVLKGKEKKPKVEKLKPSDAELEKATCEILEEADFNTATFTDILQLLVKRFNTDLVPRKSTIKLMVKEFLMKLAEEEDDEEDEDVALKDDKQASGPGLEV